MNDETKMDAAFEWATYRKDYGVPTEHMNAAHEAFLAGYKAALEGAQDGALR